MIAKCLAVLAVVAQINASGCTCGLSSLVPSVGNVLVSGNSGFGDSGAVTRNLVGQGKFPVAMSNCGPTPENNVPVITSSYTTPLQEKPTLRLPAVIPPPRVISHTCTCYKTILRPRVHQEIITVPTIERYVETTHKPVVENIQYEALPVNCGCSSASGVQFFENGSGALTSGSVELFSTTPTQTVAIPSVQTLQVPPPSFGGCSC